MVEMVRIPGGQYIIGTNQADGFPKDKEGPQVKIEIASFDVDVTTVTNQDFKDFVESTGYVTESEKYGWSYVFHYFLTTEEIMTAKEVLGLNWWYAVEGADWKHPEGINSRIIERMDHPVVQVSRNDALAYCQWRGTRLPTEAEWEIAAKGGTNHEKYPWGNSFLVDGNYQCNIWQGNFPLSNTTEDGFLSTAPAKNFAPNGYGIYQMIGNVWEWCLNPQGIDLADFKDFNSNFYEKECNQFDANNYAIRGGSFLCHESYCKRYRIAARNGNSGDSASNNTGFRTVKN